MMEFLIGKVQNGLQWDVQRQNQESTTATYVSTYDSYMLVPKNDIQNERMNSCDNPGTTRKWTGHRQAKFLMSIPLRN